jgi:hypothetical protein
MPRVSRLPREAEALASADPPALAAHVSAPVLLLPGEPGGRFIYLSWGTVDGTAGFTLFRRAKLWLGAVPADVLDQALDLGMLVGRLGLTDPKGNPLCAAVRPPVIDWSAAAHSG